MRAGLKPLWARYALGYCSYLKGTKCRPHTSKHRRCDLLRPGVRFLEGFAEAFGVDVRVDLRCRDVRVPEHFLDAHDFGAVFEQVRCEAVAQHVRARFAFPADFA